VHVEVSLDRDDDWLNSDDGGIARADAPPHFEVTRRTPSVRCGQGPATSATATTDGYLYRLERPGGSISRLAAITAMVAIRHPVLLGSPVSRSCAPRFPGRIASGYRVARLRLPANSTANERAIDPSCRQRFCPASGGHVCPLEAAPACSLRV
jgi:hypothetical protein